MQKSRLQLVNKLGLHARAASKFAQTCARFSADVKVQCNGKCVDGKSVMALMLLAAGKGTELELEVTGRDEEDALNAITKLVADRFGEAE
ncbi:HPr family phosphocarrier protein [Microbulbifer thermotolerans]|uniref:HPr family phosphocarrier protein n=1 Tax=Microbulbifer thermotolerans TaxID=252514 RepID=UPI0008E061BD|nr:HPr family phosphocarrier protein [Microbulbifer thermotolerans]MCX2780793.1 HPr family phosphocarrier protein [Microbulbifer thermotolerans]MCX2783109.1 HPr family phosphocarrier protein [Microbulbifer thermotolerans]MCX2794289.1 HPr family phosphocarrier protein [Microbulbifer thermotolerans]MCX2806476.1 HPr family phosphocarrier protein [Microbulbifer thermotolerans]MCX2834248.1 HPr family phosphocarrier protein [Microbulbifer thermotolerans]